MIKIGTKTGLRTSPYGANQSVMDPRQKICWELYVTPGTKFFSNACRSAIKAGYGPRYATTITARKWFKNKIGQHNLSSKAEKSLTRLLDYESIDKNGKINIELLRLQTDIAKQITLKAWRRLK